MVEKLTFLKIAKITLDKVKRPLSAIEIWEEFNKLEESKQFSTKGKTPWYTISADIYIDLRDNPNSEFVQFSKRPARFTLKKFADTVKEVPEKKGKTSAYRERDLHPLLCTFVYANQHFKCHVKTIKHEGSSSKKKGKNEWLHPDLVGVYLPFDDFNNITLKFQNALSLSSVKLFSFEMKKELNFTNLREYYFQAVSNSSWANEGYLVVLNLDEDVELIDEIRRLNNAFGIGVIKLNPQNIHESEILFQAKENFEIDWSTIDRLVEENPDFKAFITDVEEDMRITKVKGNYDKIFSDQELDELIQSKIITE
jgi:hypothetical protein